MEIMKNKLLHIVFTFFILNSAFSQEDKTESQINREFGTVGTIENFSFLDKINRDNLQYTSNNISNVQQNTYVTVTQIGDYNFSSVNVNANSARINIEQNGFNNAVDIDKSGNQINESIYQNGSNNYIQDQSYYSNQNSTTQFTQLGDNLNLYNYGSNSISEGLNIVQTGSQKTIIIINN